MSRIKTILAYALAAMLVGFVACRGSEQDHDHEAYINHEDHADHEGHESHDHHDSGKDDDHDHEDGLIEFSSSKQKSAGIQTEVVKTGTFHGVLTTGGRILSASGDEKIVSATGSGIVRFARDLTDGMQVASGTPLFSISAADMADEGQSGQAVVAVNGAKIEYERARKLAEERLITEKELQEARLNYEMAQKAASAIGQTKSRAGVSIASPMTGYVKEIMVRPGAYVSAGEPLMVITGNKNLYLRAEVPERHYAELSRVVSANFKPSYSEVVYSVADLGGRKVGSSTTTAANSRMIPVTFEFPNSAGLLAGAYAEVTLLLGNRDGILTVPKSALIEDQGIFHVFVRHDGEHFEKRVVRIGSSDGLRCEVLSGLKDGDEVVSKGAMKLKLASATTAIPAHTHNH